MKKLIGFFLKKERFTQGAAVLSGLTFLSYVTGLLRDRMFARTFGASRELDLFNASFLIPDLLLNIFVMSALSAAFIPVFSGLMAQEKHEEANRLGNSILHSAVLVILVLGGVTAIFMPQLAKFIAPGFSPTELHELIKLARLMLISPLLMAVSNTFGSILVSFKRFAAYGISPVLYNLGIIAGALTAPWFGVYGLVLGTLFGALLHLAPRMLALRKGSFRHRVSLQLRDTNFRHVLKLMIPKMFGHPVEQLTFLGFTRIATLMAAGSVASMNFARNFQSVPVSLFGIAISVAAYPVLCEHAARGERSAFLKNFWKALKNILLLTVASSIGLYFLAELPIRIFLGGGKFSEENILLTAGLLAAFSLSIPTESAIHLLARSFYALKNTITPVIMSVAFLVIGVGFASYYSASMGILAIPYGFFLGSLVEMILLSLALWRKTAALNSSPQLPPSGS